MQGSGSDSYQCNVAENRCAIIARRLTSDEVSVRSCLSISLKAHSSRAMFGRVGQPKIQEER